MQPVVSIVLPVRDRELRIRNAIKSVLNQQFKHWELIVIDDGSKDATADVVKNYVNADRRIRLIEKAKVDGPAKSRNIGIGASSGKYIMFLDSDDTIKEFCLAQRVHAFETHHSYDFLVFNTLKFDESDGVFMPYNFHSSQDLLESLLKRDNIWTVTGPIYKRKLFSDILSFDESLIADEDYALHFETLTNGLAFKIVEDFPSDNVYHSHPDHSVSKQSKAAFGRDQHLLTWKAFLIYSFNKIYQDATIWKPGYAQHFKDTLLSTSLELLKCNSIAEAFDCLHFMKRKGLLSFKAHRVYVLLFWLRKQSDSLENLKLYKKMSGIVYRIARLLH